MPREFARRGDFAATTLRIGGGIIQVALRAGPTPVPRPALLHWLSNAAEAIAGYYQRFPIERLLDRRAHRRGWPGSARGWRSTAA